MAKPPRPPRKPPGKLGSLQDVMQKLQNELNDASSATRSAGQQLQGDLKEARELAEKVLQNGGTQEMGPLNSYERRIVHLTVAEIDGVSSESIGDASVKKVIISAD